MPRDTIDIVDLKRSRKQDELYNLFVQTFNSISDGLQFLVVTRKYEMRLDLVTSDLYGSVEYIGFLMKLNDIYNPYSIKLGDIIFYIHGSSLADTLFQDPSLSSTQRDELVNTLKANQFDDNRRKFLDAIRNRDDLLPPTISKPGVSKSVIENDKIKVAPDLFNNPNTGLGTTDPEPLSTGLGNIFADLTRPDTGQLPTDAENAQKIKSAIVRDQTAELDETERVLVQRFIRSGKTIISQEDLDEENNENNQNNQTQ